CSGAQAGVLSPQTQLAPWAEVLPACTAGPDLPECPSGLSPGMSLLQEVVYLVSQGADLDEIGLKNIDEQLPVLEYPQPGLDIIKELTSPRLIKSHLPYRFLPSDLHNGDSKVIYMARNPKDLVVSYYQFHRSLQTMSYRGTFQEFCRRFMNDKLGYGSWFEHVQEFWEHRMDANVLFLKYEDMHRVSAGDAVPWGPLPAGAVGCAEESGRDAQGQATRLSRGVHFLLCSEGSPWLVVGIGSGGGWTRESCVELDQTWQFWKETRRRRRGPG
uniref:Sulfotransferase n=1 Tax=Spermophilus dauricus TaxID=99837 RepID=A0A8C9QRJ8_SPEDA